MSLRSIFSKRLSAHVRGAGQGLGLIKDVPDGVAADFGSKQLAPTTAAAT